MNHINKITEPEAIRELDVLRKEIKTIFECDDWENIAQKPIIRQIFKYEISNKDRWLSDAVIQENTIRTSV